MQPTFKYGVDYESFTKFNTNTPFSILEDYLNNNLQPNFLKDKEFIINGLSYVLHKTIGYLINVYSKLKNYKFYNGMLYTVYLKNPIEITFNGSFIINDIMFDIDLANVKYQLTYYFVISKLIENFLCNFFHNNFALYNQFHKHKEYLTFLNKLLDEDSQLKDELTNDFVNIKKVFKLNLSYEEVFRKNDLRNLEEFSKRKIYDHTNLVPTHKTALCIEFANRNAILTEDEVYNDNIDLNNLNFIKNIHELDVEDYFENEQRTIKKSKLSD